MLSPMHVVVGIVANHDAGLREELVNGGVRNCWYQFAGKAHYNSTFSQVGFDRLQVATGDTIPLLCLA